MGRHKLAVNLAFTIGAAFLTISTRISATPLIVYTEKTVAPGSFEYEYTAQNSLTSPSFSNYNLYDIVFSFPDTPSVIAVPAGWDFQNLGNSVEVSSLFIGAPPIGTDLPPGNSLEGFIFETDVDAPAQFIATFSNPNDAFSPLSISGVAEFVPESGTGCLGLIGIALASFSSKKWR